MAFKYKASVEEIDEVIEEEEERVCVKMTKTQDDIYLQVLEYIQEVETKIEKKTDEEMVPPQFHAYLDVFKKGTIGAHACAQTMGSCNRSESQLCTSKV